MTMNGEEFLPGKYMTRNKFYVPKKEIERYYKKDGDPDPNDFFFECDFEGVDMLEW